MDLSRLSCGATLAARVPRKALITCKGTTKDPADVDAEPAGAESDIGVQRRSRSRSRSRNSSEAESGAGVAGATSWDNLTEEQTVLTEAELR